MKFTYKNWIELYWIGAIHFLLKNDDLNQFAALVKDAEAGFCPASTRSIEDLLNCDGKGLTNSDFFCLCKSLKIATVAGDIPSTAANIANYIRQNTNLDRYIDLSAAEYWKEAIGVAMKAISTGDAELYSASFVDREDNVGNACVFLRNQGYPVSIDAFGCHIEQQTVACITSRINKLTGIIGGIECLNQIFRILSEQDRYHDGFWLFGDQLPSIMAVKPPTLPYAWLARVALQNMSRKKRARKPDVAWKNLTELATQFAACCNFERYSQWENFNLQPGDLGFLFSRAAGWQQLFMLKQMPAQALVLITRALEDKLDCADLQAVSMNAKSLFAELRGFVARCPLETVSTISPADAKRSFPVLCEEIEKLGPLEKFFNPFDQAALSHESRLLLPCDGDKLLMLPRSLTAAAASTFLIELIWKRLKKSAEKIVGDTFERVVELACSGKAAGVYSDVTYSSGKTRFQIDVATVSDNLVNLFEVKAKAMTREARSGRTIKFLADYAESFLFMLKQLVRNEQHFRAGIAMSHLLHSSPKDCSVNKIAVSALSYGPIGDHVLANGILESLSRAIITPITPNVEDSKRLSKLLDSAREILSIIDKFYPRAKDKIDLHSYMINVFWLDLGELIYMLGRANSVTNAIAPLKHVTFSTRCVWTEIANADRSTLTAKYWTPLA